MAGPSRPGHSSLGNNAPPSFGRHLLTMEDRAKGCDVFECCDWQVKLSFFENFLVLQSYKHWCGLYPKQYRKIVIPKFKIVGVEFHSSNTPRCYVFSGLFLLILGAAATLSLHLNLQQACSSSCWVLAIGFILVVGFMGFVLVVGPCCCCKYYAIHFKLSTDIREGFRGPFFSARRLAAMWNRDDELVVHTSNHQPDEAFISGYVYGHLGDVDVMTLCHRAAALIEAGIVAEIHPHGLANLSQRSEGGHH